MGYSLRQAFKHKDIKDARVFLREASFYLGALTTEIRVRLYVKPDDEETIFYEQSHFLRTPRSADHSSTGTRFADSIEEAFAEAVTDLTDAYELAVMAGHRPREDWLEANPYF